MAILSLRLFTDRILSTPCEPVTDFTGLEELVQNMFETMEKHNGIGLAAPQIGINKQIAVMSLENKTKKIIVANPRVLRYTKEKDTQKEGCLSSPSVSIPIKRYKGVEVEFQNIFGEKIQMRFTDYDARIFQHEFDHLCGKMIIHNLKLEKLK